MSGAIRPFRPGETKLFSVLLKIDGVAQDITGDTVTFRMKSNKDDTDLQAVLTKAADVASEGASGIANFELTPSDTDDLTPDTYYCDIEWALVGGREFVAYDNTVEVKERVSDA